MKLLAWNCRGLPRPSAIRSLRSLIRNVNPDILFLSENKNCSCLLLLFLHSLGFYLSPMSPPLALKGVFC
ncbi:hypothetical protein SLA2020_370600 [Shorea laevis]